MKKFITTLKTTFTVVALLSIVSCSNNTEELNLETSTTNVDQLAKKAAKTYRAKLNMLNNSGVSGTAELILNGDQLTVIIHAQGLVPDMLHPQHIHGFVTNNRNSTCPPPSADTDGNGFISVPEGAPFYGSILKPLMPFPTAPNGTIVFEQTYTLTESLSPLQNRAIVLHGLNVNGMYDATLPVACGQIMADQGQ